ncbi:Alpha/Beta hydrolase protein [Mycena polygramma]|nr:Alpha/Beta hydrolase protein [Mycena polygramma]
MGHSLLFYLTACLSFASSFTASAATGTTDTNFNVQPFKVDLAAKIPRFKSLVENTRLPDKALYPNFGPEKGIELDVLGQLRADWLTKFDWGAQQAELNQFEQFTAVIEGITVHFVHEKSADPDAIPIILFHGWPGKLLCSRSFHEFVPVIKPLTQPANVAGKNVSYHVVVPSLPGFVFSSAPPANWTVDDTAKVFNTLMSEVLGYSTFAVHGTDWGSGVAYSMYASFNTTVRAGHFAFLPFFPPTAQEIAADNITLSDIQKVSQQRNAEWSSTGNAYFLEQQTKPNDIGLALYDSPVGQLAWIGAKSRNISQGSDPRAGTPPSVLNNTAILTSVSLYYLTDSFLSSVWIYGQNPNGFKAVYEKAPTDARLLFSQYEYNVGFWPQEYVAKVGNLVSYKVHDFGGHFAGLDNPLALIEDIRDLGRYFKA